MATKTWNTRRKYPHHQHRQVSSPSYNKLYSYKYWHIIFTDTYQDTKDCSKLWRFQNLHCEPKETHQNVFWYI